MEPSDHHWNPKRKHGGGGGSAGERVARDPFGLSQSLTNQYIHKRR